MKEILARMLTLQGAMVPRERQETIARTVDAVLEAERTATRALPFETEPSGFLGELEKVPQ